MTMSLISTATVGAGGAASILFSAIPQDGTDLLLLLSLRTETGGVSQDAILRVNGTAVGNGRILRGTGSAVSSSQTDPLSNSSAGNGATANTFSNNSIYIPNYSRVSAKSYSIDTTVESNDTEGYQIIVAGSITATAAITSLELALAAGIEFAQNSSASLYKITKGSTPGVVVS